MTQIHFSIFDPNTLLYHRAGIAGLALALEVLDLDHAPLTWEITEESVTLSWDCSDKEALLWLLHQTYQIKEGYLDVPALHLDEQSKYVFTQGITSTFLQHSKQRKREKQSISLNFTVDENQPEINLNFRPLTECYYTGELKEAFNSKGMLKNAIPLKGNHLPGLVECFIHGPYKESPERFIALLFLPLACSYYQLPHYRSAVVIPEINHLQQWVKIRQQSAGLITQRISRTAYGNYRASSAGEAALRFLWQERLHDEIEDYELDYCEVYQLGKQPWDGQQSYLKQAVYRVQATEQVLALYQSAYQFFPPVIRQNKQGERFLALSTVLPWIAENLVANQPWYAGFYEFNKRHELYERKGLIKMTQKLEDHEREFFEAVRGAFGLYRWKQIKAAKDQKREPDYEQITNKVVYRLQRPSTQKEFAEALVKFLSQNRSTTLLGKGLEIYQWIHGKNWQQARDLALLAIATYQSRRQDNPEGEETPDSASQPFTASF